MKRSGKRETKERERKAAACECGAMHSIFYIISCFLFYPHRKTLFNGMNASLPLI